MTRNRRFLASGAAMSALFTVLAAMAPTPSGAQQQPPITVAPGQTVTTKVRALVGNNYAMGRRPASCALATRNSCDTHPVVLDVSAEDLQTEEYIVTVRTTWNTRAKQNVQLVGDVSDNQVNTYVYLNPPRIVTTKDEDTGEETKTETEETSAFLSPSPTELTVFRPATPGLLITVENMYGVNDGYTLEVGLADLGGGPGADLSADEGGPFDFSDDTGVGVTPSFSGDSGPAGGISLPVAESFAGFADISDAAGPIALDILSPRGDGDLDNLGGVKAVGSLELDEVKKIGRVSSGPPPPQSASGVVLALWFGLLPAALAAGAFFFIKRRRMPTPS